jgi:MFS family permease
MSNPLMRVVSSWVPAAPVARRLCAQTFIYSLALGVILPGNAAYFTRHVGLSLQEFGTAFSIATAVAFLLAIPLGRVSDRIGAQVVWLSTALIEGVAFMSYPLVGAMLQAVLVMSVLEVAAITGNSARMAYTLEVLPDEGRVRALAQTRIWFNIGAASGGAATGLALSLPSGLAGIPILTGLLTLVNAASIRRLPPTGARLRRRPNPLTSGALRDRRFVTLALVMGLVGSSAGVMNVVLPAWMLSRTAIPASALGAFFVLNTVLVVLLQVPLSKGAETLVGAAHSGRVAGLLMAATCLVAVGLSFSTIPWVIIAVGVAVFSVLTASEIFYSASRWGVFAEVAPEDGRAEYQSLYQLGARAALFVVPAAFTLLLSHWGAWGWVPFSAAYAAVALALPVVVRRYAANQPGRVRGRQR